MKIHATFPRNCIRCENHILTPDYACDRNQKLCIYCDFDLQGLHYANEVLIERKVVYMSSADADYWMHNKVEPPPRKNEPRMQKPRKRKAS